MLSHSLCERKCGHLGTLDPFASGLLVVALGKATKLLPYLDDRCKTYIGVLSLGSSTDTGDLIGNIDGTAEVPDLDMESISSAMKAFLGRTCQVPPKYSAVKVSGQEAYKLARKGEEFSLSGREIEIKSLNPVNYDREKKEIVFTCTVSKGTYVRVLAEDIAKKLGTLGHLAALRRTAVGNILVSMAKKPEEIGIGDVIDPTLLIRGMKHVEISSGDEKKVMDGMPLELESDYGEKVFLCLGGKALAVYRRKEGKYYVSERGLW